MVGFFSDHWYQVGTAGAYNVDTVPAGIQFLRSATYNKMDVFYSADLHGLNTTYATGTSVSECAGPPLVNHIQATPVITALFGQLLLFMCFFV